MFRESWEQQPTAFHSVIEFVQEMQHIDTVSPIVQKHLEEAQRAQQRSYNHSTQPIDAVYSGRWTFM